LSCGEEKPNISHKKSISLSLIFNVVNVVNVVNVINVVNVVNVACFAQVYSL